jgi:hypothetical protein
VEAALVPELDPLALPLLDPELLPLLEPLELLDALPELLPLDDELLELPELLDALPEELLLELPPLLLPDVALPPLDVDPLLEPDDPLPPEEPAGVPGDVWPPDPEGPYTGVPPPVSLELQAHRQSARAAIAAAVGPLDVRRMVWDPIASTGPCWPAAVHAAHVQRGCDNRGDDVAVSLGRNFAMVGARRQVDRLERPYRGATCRTPSCCSCPKSEARGSRRSWRRPWCRCSSS